jgi:sigma-E factor negative regulatory protein RseC
MEKVARIASHDGIVKKVRKGFVEVQIKSISACATCQAHARCGFAESKDKTVEVPTSDWQSYSEGERVTVHIDESRGMLAVWIAYVLPALLLIAAIVTLSLIHLPEWAVVLSAFAVLGLYILVLYLSRRKVESRFTLTISSNCEANS